MGGGNLVKFNGLLHFTDGFVMCKIIKWCMLKKVLF